MHLPDTVYQPQRSGRHIILGSLLMSGGIVAPSWLSSSRDYDSSIMEFRTSLQGKTRSHWYSKKYSSNWTAAM